MINDARGNETHAVVTMINNSSHHDLTLKIDNLRLKLEVDPNTGQSLNEQFYERNAVKVTYLPAELILYENQKRLGLIVEVQADCLKVLNEYNSFDTVKISEVNKKVVHDKRLSIAVDQENNVLTRGTIIKIRDRSSLMKGQIGEIRCLFKDSLFVWIKNS